MFMGLFLYIFQLDAYIWLCDNEKNSSACFLAGKSLDDRGNELNGQDYYQKACDLKYELGCREFEKPH